MRLSKAYRRVAPRGTVWAIAVILVGSLVATSAARGADWYYWDADGNGSAATGGSGNWMDANTWRNGSPSGSLGNWLDNNKPVLAGTAGAIDLGWATVNLGASDDATSALRVETAGYTINNGILAMQGGPAGAAPSLFVGGSLTTNAIIQSTGNLQKTGAGMLTLTGIDQIPVPGQIAVTDGFLDAGINAAGIRKGDETAACHNVVFDGGLTSYGVIQGSGNIGGNPLTAPYGNVVKWGGENGVGNGGIAARGGKFTLSAGDIFNLNSAQGRSRLTFGSPTADSEAVFQAHELVVDGNGLSNTFFVVDNPDSTTDLATIQTWLSPRANPGVTGIIKNGDGVLQMKLVKNSGYGERGALDPLFSGTTTIRAGTLIWSSAESYWQQHGGAVTSVTSPMVLGDSMTLVSGGVKAVASANISLAGTSPITDGAASIPLAAGDKVLVIGQTDKAENGVYVVGAGAWTRTSDVMDKGLRAWVQQGDNYGGRYVYQYAPGADGSNDWRLDAGGGDAVNVALLTNGACGIGSDIQVVANGSSGTSTLGGYATQTGSSSFTGQITLHRDVQLTSSTTGADVVTFSGNILQSGGPFSVTKVGPGTVVLSGTNNTYAGGTTVAEGRLSFATADSVPLYGDLVAAAGGYMGVGYQTSGASFTSLFNKAATQGVLGFEVAPLTGTISLSGFGANVRLHTRAAVTLSNAITPPGTVYRFGGGGGVLTVNSSLGGSRSLEMGTSGNLLPGVTILGGSNTYSGGTNVSAGYLVFAVPGAIPSTGKIVVGSGGYVAPAFSISAADFLNKFTKTASSGVIGVEGTLGGSFDLTGFHDSIRLGSRVDASIDETSTITPPGNTYRLGGGPGTLTVNSILSDNGGARNLDVGTSGTLEAGTVVLAGANTFSGATTVTAGTLRLGHDSALGASTATIDVQNGATLDLGSYTSSLSFVRLSDGTITGGPGASLSAPTFDLRKGTVSAVLAGGNLTKSTEDLVALSGSNTYTGTTTLSGGTLSINTLAYGGSSSSIGASSAIAANLVLDGGTLEFTGGYTVTTDRLFTLGPGGGAIAVSAGSMNLIGTGAIAQTGAGPRQLTLHSGGTALNLLYSTLGDRDATSPTSLAKTGTGTWLLNGDNTFTGPITVSGGTLQVGGVGSTGKIVGPASLAGGTKLVLRSGLGNWTYDGAISGAGAVVNSGTGVLTLGGANTYSGGTTLDAGWTVVKAANGLGTGPVTIGLATLRATGNTPYTLSNPVTLANAMSTIDVPNLAGVTLAGKVTGNGALKKVGAGTLILANDTTYPGGTVIAEGMLQVGAGGTTGNIGGTIMNNGTLIFNRSDDIEFGISVTGNGNLVKAGAGALTISSRQEYGGATSVQQGTLKLTTLPIPGGMGLWLDAESGVQTNGATVSQWNDRSGLGRHATQENPAWQPVYITNDLANGHHVISFDGNNKFFDVDLSFLASKNYTIFAVEGRTSDKGTPYIATGIQGTYDYNPEIPNVSLQIGYSVDGTGVTKYYIDQWYNTSAVYASSFAGQSFDMWAIRLEQGVSRKIFRGGIETTDLAGGTPTPLTPGTDSHHYWPATDHGRIGSGRNFNRKVDGWPPPVIPYYEGDIAEIIIYDRALSDEERQAVEIYFLEKWYGIPAEPASDILPPTTTLAVSAGATLDLAGTSQHAAALSDGAGGGTITNSGELDSVLTVTGEEYGAFSGTIQDGPTNLISLVKDGGATLTLGGPNTFTGGTTVLGGTLEITNSQALPAGQSLTIGADGTVVLGADPSNATGAQGTAAAVPEPSALLLLVTAGGVALLASWRRRQRQGGR